MPRRFRPWLLVLGLVCLAACTRTPAEPRWVQLARDWRGPDLLAEVRAFEAEAGRTDTRVEEQEQGAALGRRVRAADWHATDGVLRQSLAGGAFARLARSVRLELQGARPPARLASGDGPLAPGEYRYAEGELVLAPHPSWGAVPEGLVRARAEHGRPVEGGWQVRLGGHCALGVPLWSGTREEFTLDLPAASELRFRFAFDAPRTGAELRLVVTLDGEPCHELRTPTLGPEALLEACVELPARAHPGARLAFALEGPPGLGLVFTPVIGPRAHGTPDARPWGTPRPDIVLVLVDTLRADALAPYGGAPELAPALNAFAAQARVFSHARSNAAWTLPSVATLLTGLQPGQHGATDEDSLLPLEESTVVEAFARAGYRTGAITDANFVSPVHGLAQGFEWFSEHYNPEWETWEQRPERSWNLRRTLDEARAFLAADDGRPTFLLVHTYRVHEPYRVGPEEDPRPNRATLLRAAEVAGMKDPPPDVGRRAMLSVMPELIQQYQAGVRDLDQKLGPFLAELEAARFFERGYLILTSDHGEALGENQDYGHGNHLWEVKLRVPLLLRGPGLAPEAVTPTATLLDLAPTLAALGGLEHDPRWSGESLLTLTRERAAVAWQLGSKSHQLALREGTRKLITTPTAERLAAGACEEAFDLALDPGEERNLLPAATWPAELLRTHAPALTPALPTGPGERIELSPERRRQLQGLGYGDEGEHDEPPPAKK